MKIIQVSTYDIEGGAAIASYRLHRGLRKMGEECRMLVRHKSSVDDTVIRVLPRQQTEQEVQEFFLRTVIQGLSIDSNRTDISNTMFTLPYPGYDIACLPPVQEADIINLHWVSGFQSPITLRKLFSLGKPVVWTLHDQGAFSGGCHYAAGCAKYQTDCADCPQLADDPFNLPAAVLRDKQALLSPANLTIVTPSRWLASCARESSLFRKLRVEVLPNSLDTDFFTFLPKEGAKKDLGLSTESVTLLFGATDCGEKRKGFSELLSALRLCLAHHDFRTLAEGGRLKILCFGHPDSTLNHSGLPIIPLGYLGSPERVKIAYAGADLFILPSLEDNLPNTILEALSCGTPVVAFATGGIPEVVKDGENGRLAPVGDSQALARAILSLVLHPEESAQMGRNGRNLMVEEYSLPIQAQRYKTLYQELVPGLEPRQPFISRRETCNPAQWEGTSPADGFQANLETALGPHVQAIFDPVLFRVLKRFTPGLHRLWQSTEADRAARMEQIVELTRMLKEAEADRAARMEQIVELTWMHKEAEADRAQLNRQVVELNAHWTVKMRRKLSGLFKRSP
jgi:glycosyltransferase involved in cell wall biosynthesis